MQAINKKALTGFPASASALRLPHAKKFDARATALLAGIRADGAAFTAFPSACSGHSVAVMKAECARKKNLAGYSSVLPLRGQRRLKVSAF